MPNLLDTSNILAHPITRWGLLAAGAALALTPAVNALLLRFNLLDSETRRHLWWRYFTWLALTPVLALALLLCPASAIISVGVISLLCYREYARATGLFRERILSAIVVLGIVLIAFASADNWFRLFVALNPLAIVVLAAAAVIRDEPRGYIQRVALAVVGFLLIGAGLGHLGFIANDPHFRPILVVLVMCAQLSDITAFCFGRAIGRGRLFPNTSPRKTIAGHAVAFVVVAVVAAVGAGFVFEGQTMDNPWYLAGLGIIVAVGAQLGDLVMASIKRDIGIKDMAATLPGHGGFLDRFNSVLLIAPAAFYYIYAVNGFTFPDPIHRLLGRWM